MIEIKNVTKKYSNIKAVDNISFDVKDGEIVGFLGPNGAGKTTTMNMLTGFIEPTEGQIIINGFDISKKAKKAKKQIGYMPEGVPLYTELTAKEFVTYMAELKGVKSRERKENVQKVLEETGLKDVQNKLIRNLSRGYKQRVGMAGALVGNPDVIILDEPTVGLDPKQITEIRTLIKNLGKKHTVILSSHILSEVSQICERVVIINNGKIVAIDTPENLENKTKEKNTIIVTVEDEKDNMKTIKEKIANIEEVKLIKENEDGTKQYSITSSEDVDLRKTLSKELVKEDITILELKKSEATLEDAFIKLIDTEKKEAVPETKLDKKAQKEAKKANKTKKAEEKANKKDEEDKTETKEDEKVEEKSKTESDVEEKKQEDTQKTEEPKETKTTKNSEETKLEAEETKQEEKTKEESEETNQEDNEGGEE